MKNAKKIQKVLMTGCLIILFLFTCSIVIRLFTRQVLIVGMGMDNAFTRLVFFDNVDMQRQPGYQAMVYGDTDDYSVEWAAEYPFDNIEQPISAEDAPKSSGILDRYTQIVASLKGRIENYVQADLVGYTAITEMGSAYEKAIGWNFSPFNEYNGIYQMSDGYWTVLKSKKDMSEHISSFISFHEFCEENEVDFLYVQAPYKISKYEDVGLSGVTDFSNQNADDLLNGLEAAGIDIFDLRAVIYEEGLSHHQLFFQTDHHWKGETGLWAAARIAEHLNVNYGFQIDSFLLKPEEFYNVNYPEFFLGSLGRKVTLGRAKPEDISLLYPKYETYLHFEIPSIGIDLTGDFSITYNMEAVDDIDYYNKDPYHVYSYGDRAVIRYENFNKVQEDKKILFIHDSFSDCVVSFLALGLQKMEALDLRYFTGSLEAYIEESQPDMIIVMYNAGELSFDVDMTTHTNLYDFR